MAELKRLEECSVKGSSLKAVLRYMNLKWGKAYTDSLNLPFNPEEIKNERYYPYVWMRTLHTKVAEKSAGREEQTFKKLGYDVVNAALEGHFLINYIVKRRSLEKIFEDMEKNSEYINVFEGNVTKKDGKIYITADQICEDRSEQMCWTTEGALNALVKASKKNATVKHVKCVFHGDDHCIYEIVEN